MRGMTAAVVAGVVVVLIAAVMYMRSGNTAEPAPQSRQPTPAAARRRSPKNAARGSKKRLTELRDDVDHRQMGSANPPPNKREVPTMSAHKRAAMQDEDTEEDDEDPQEMEELKHTLLTNPDPEERIGAVLMLTGEEGPESLRMLLDSMDDPDPEVRLAVVEALGDRSEEIGPDTLGPALRDLDAEVRFEAVSILGDMETPGSPAPWSTRRSTTKTTTCAPSPKGFTISTTTRTTTTRPPRRQQRDRSRCRMGKSNRTGEALKAQAAARVDSERAALLELSARIHAHPELCYTNTAPPAGCADYLESRSFAVERGAYGLPTAFAATLGSGRPRVAVLCEYDALPGIGHACGHNVIAAAERRRRRRAGIDPRRIGRQHRRSRHTG